MQYLDSSYQRLPDGTYEVFILMEFCSGGGIIDLLNQRLRNRLTEQEILEIFTDVCEAVAAMHSLDQPLLHRDLKIENVLSAPTSRRPGGRMYKLCDFGSTVHPSNHAPTTKAEAEKLAHDLNKHTTLQYRSPEMVDPMFQRPVGLPSDVWALGVLLYKLCYYTTPFETQGILAIANAKYEFPSYPNYSPGLQHLIAGMLVEAPTSRLNVYQVLQIAHELNHTRPAVDYVSPAANSCGPQLMFQSAQRERARPFSMAPKQVVRNPKNALDFTDPSEPSRPAAPEVPLAATVQPQRRGRPTRDSRDLSGHAQVSPPPIATNKTTGTLQRKLSVKSSSPGTQSMPATSPVQHPSPHLPAGSVASVKSKFEQQASKRMSLPHRSSHSPLDRLQVTGEGRKNAASRKSSIDAFGLHTSAPKVTSPLSFGDSFSSASSSRDGFSDAFGAKVSKHAERQFTDAFNPNTGQQPERQFTDAFKPTGTQQRSVSTASGFSDSFSATHVPSAKRSVSGFTDSFTNTSIVSSPSSVSPKLASLDRTNSSGLSSTLSAEDRKSASSTPDGERSFETRFPSVETLHGRSSSSPSQSKPRSQEPPNVPPAKEDASHGHARRGSTMIANRTGGDIPKSKSHVPILKQPQPRSTQVTGTAFKRDSHLMDEGASLEPPAANNRTTPSPTADYLDLLDDEETAELLPPPDLLDEDDQGRELELKPMKPSISRAANSGSRFGVAPPVQAKKPLPTPKPKPQVTPNKPLGAAEHATLPRLSSARPTSNFNSEQWSPLESMKGDSKARSPQPTHINLDSDSSDGDGEGPEDPTGWRHSARTPLQQQQQRSFRRPSPDMMRRVSSFEPGSGPSSPTHQHQRHGSGGGGVSAHDSSAGGSVRRRDVSSAEGHNRRSSVIDMKTRFEALNTGATSANGHGTAPGAQGLGRRATTAGKPAVAAKPPTLRRLSGPRPQPKLAAGPKPPLPPTPVPKPAALRKGSTAAGAASQSASQSHGEASQSQNQIQSHNSAADGSSWSGRTLPASPGGERPATAARTNSHGSDRSSSPEKQLPIKERIQKWNRGELRRTHRV